MRSFKQFLFEMPESGAMASELEPGDIKPAGRYDRVKYVGSHENYNIEARSWKSPNNNSESRPHHYLAVTDNDEDNDVVHFSTRGGNTPDGYLIANETRKHPDAELTAPDFYKAILHSEGAPNGIQSGEKHSEGGKSIWHRLSLDPELVVTHHRKSDCEEIKLHTGDNFHKNYDQEPPTFLRAKLKQ